MTEAGAGSETTTVGEREERCEVGAPSPQRGNSGGKPRRACITGKYIALLALAGTAALLPVERSTWFSRITPPAMRSAMVPWNRGETAGSISGGTKSVTVRARRYASKSGLLRGW